MDLLQKYTEDKLFYELDEAVILTFEELTILQSTKILLLIEKIVPNLKIVNKRSQIIGGVLNEEKGSVFFALRYIYEEDNHPYFFQLFSISSDEYLDLFNENKVILL
jgi:hypothetical protein